MYLIVLMLKVFINCAKYCIYFLGSITLDNVDESEALLRLALLVYA